ncbi:unnamed protein product, partial [Mesorhabditis spiculigera]
MRAWAILLLFFCAYVFADEPLDVKPPEGQIKENADDAPQQMAAPTFESSSSDSEKADLSFYHGFFASFSVIIVSELGDKTWFIAVIMSMKHSRLAVFSGAIAALALMTVLSACMGWVTVLIPRWITYYISTALFALFGLKMLHEGYYMNASETQEVFEESQAEVQKRELARDTSKIDNLEGGAAQDKNSAALIFAFVSRIFFEAFTLTFLAEENIPGVIIGGVLGHAICTGIAVMGGKLVAQRISVRTVTLVGGVVFLIFALSTFFISESPGVAG